jgi:hypothetical protein
MKENKKTNGNSSKQKEEEEKFPGYPHYRKEEDITNIEDRVDADIEDVPRAVTGNTIKEITTSNGVPEEEDGQKTPIAAALDEKAAIKRSWREIDDEEVRLVEGNEADLSEEEVDELERDGVTDHNFHPSELDIPGAELDDESEEIGDEDEENNYYSLGGDDKENLEENPDR